MSIEQDWKWLFDYEFFDSPGYLGKQLRCMFDLRDRLAAVERRLDSIQPDVDVALNAVIEKEQPDPSEWVGDICMFRDDDDVAWLGPDMLTNVVGDRYYDEGSNWWEAVRPATDEERTRYKGEPPTVNGELCRVRSVDKNPWEAKPRRFVGLTDDGRFVTQAIGSASLDLFAWEKARKLTPFELKQHQAGQEESK